GAEHGPMFATAHGEGDPLKDLLSATSEVHFLQIEDGGRCGVDFHGDPRRRRLTGKAVMIGGHGTALLDTPIGSPARVAAAHGLLPRTVWGRRVPTTLEPGPSDGIAVCATGQGRSEERRVGKEWSSRRSAWVVTKSEAGAN